MRTVALDVHKNFAEVALHEDGQLRRLGRVESKKLPAFARSLGPEDHVVLESTSVTWAVVDLLAKHAGRVTVSNPMQTKAIAQAKVKTDKVDAKVLAKLGAADFLVRRIHTKRRPAYGSPRVHAQPRRDGVRVSRKRVERPMREAGSRGRRPPPGGGGRRVPLWTCALLRDLDGPNFGRGARNGLWFADIRRITTGEGSLSMAPVIDCYSRGVLGWALAARTEGGARRRGAPPRSRTVFTRRSRLGHIAPGAAGEPLACQVRAERSTPRRGLRPTARRNGAMAQGRLQSTGLTGIWDRRRMGRRSFLRWAGMSAGTLAVYASGFSESKALAKPFFRRDPFSLGVASGDPLPDGVVLWTRLAPDPLTVGGMPNRKVPVRWEVATDESFRRVVRKGNTFATPELAHSVHVEVDGLYPAHEYFYRFKTGPELSPVGRTKTGPRLDASVGALTFAFASCQNYTTGYYAAYRDMARQDLDLVVHLGDYIYADAGGGASDPDTARVGATPRAHTLAEYRNRHAEYRTDPDLQAAHAAFPWVVTWDDHEIKNGWAGADAGPDLRELMENGFRAYYEHLPLRPSRMPRGPSMSLYRRFTFGDMADFNVLDTRQYRDDQVDCAPEDSQDGYCPAAVDPSRTILGDEQERWLLQGLDRSTARWNVLAQQVVFAEVEGNNGVAGGGDQWDGYAADRRQILEFVGARRPSNPVVISGNIHSNRVYDLKADWDEPDSETLGTEFVGTAISSGGNNRKFREGRYNTGYRDDSRNPHLKFHDNHRGYVMCSLTPQQWRTDFRAITTHAGEPDAPVTTLETFVVEDGEPGAKPA